MTALRLAIVVLALGMLHAAPAAATTVSLQRVPNLHTGEDELTYIVAADPGETNTLTISSRGDGITVTEQSGTLKAEAPCTLENAQSAVCEEQDVPFVSVTLLDLDDSLDATPLALPTQINGNEGNDVVEGGSRSDILRGGAGNDSLIGGAGTDTVSYDDLYDGGPVQVDLSDFLPDGREGEADSLDEVENLIGTRNRGDVLIGNDRANRISGQGGGDTMKGRGGDDFIDAFTGGEKVDGGPGDDVISGSLPPASRIVCGPGNDRLEAVEHGRLPRDCERARGVFSDFQAHPLIVGGAGGAGSLAIRCIATFNCNYRVTLTRRGKLVAVGRALVKKGRSTRMRLRPTSRPLRAGQRVTMKIVLLERDGSSTRDSRVTTTLATRS